MFAIQTRANSEITNPRHPVEHLELSQKQKQGGDVMAEAVFARKQVKEFSLVEPPAVLAAVFAELAWLAEYFLVRDGPGDARDGEAEQ